jgi:hypothetical protein
MPENTRFDNAIITFWQKKAELSLEEFNALYVDMMIIRNKEAHFPFVESLELPQDSDILQIQERLNTMPPQNTLLFDSPNPSVAKQG